jgi:Cu+-exporting ATPase
VVARTVYVCPMHPDVVANEPGLCPKCNMKLDLKPQVAEVRPSPTADAPRSP